MSISLALLLQELSKTTAKLCVFFPEGVLDLSSDLREPLEVANGTWKRGKVEMNSGTKGSGSCLKHCPFGNSGSDNILIGAAGAPMGNWPLTSEVCSLIVLVTSGALTVVPTVPGAVSLEILPSFSEIEG